MQSASKALMPRTNSRLDLRCLPTTLPRSVIVVSVAGLISVLYRNFQLDSHGIKMIDSNSRLVQLALCSCLLTREAQGDIRAEQANWILAEIGVGVQGVEIGHRFTDQVGVSTGWVRTRWSHPWKGQDPDTLTDTFRSMLRFSNGPFRLGVGPALRNTQGAARCDLSYRGLQGEQVRWRMTSVDMVGDMGLLFSWPQLVLGFTIVAAGRQVQRRTTDIETSLDLTDKDRSKIEGELRKDTSHGVSVLVGTTF